MERPTITIGEKTREIKNLTGRDWRILSEFIESNPEYTNADYIEKHAAFVAQFYGVTADDILNLPLGEILPASTAIRNYIMKTLTAKFEQIEKNAEKGDKTEQSL